MSWPEVAISINSILLSFLFVDYMKFRFNFQKQMRQNFVTKDLCGEKHKWLETTLTEIKDDVKEIKVEIIRKRD